MALLESRKSLKRQQGYIGFSFFNSHSAGSLEAFYIPQNGIIGLNDTTVPTDYTAFSAADGKAIRGTTSDGSIGSTGGSTSAANMTSGSDGAHTGSLDIGVTNWRQSSGTASYQIRDTTSYGNHNHTIYTTYNPPKNNIKLIQASVDTVIPANGVIWGDSDTTPENLSSFATHNGNAGVLHAASTTGTAAHSNSRTTNTWSQTHDHHLPGTGSRVNAAIALDVSTNTMSHDHNSFSSTATLNLNRIVLKAWSAASEVIATTPGVIILYNQAGVPDGWVLCDGTGGTPNLNDYFVYNNGTGGTVTNGGNTVTMSGSTNSRSHSHSYSGTPDITGTTVGHNASDSHSHTASGTLAYTPPYYYLKFIQYAG